MNKFKFDVFISYNPKDKVVVRPLAERLRKDGLKVWFDEWMLKTDERKRSKIEYGLERSRVLVLCISANAIGMDWAQLEAGTFRFRDPVNQERRFIPLRLDDTPIKGSLAQFLCINWCASGRELEYLQLLEACRPSSKVSPMEAQITDDYKEKVIYLNYFGKDIRPYTFSIDGKRALAGAADNTVRLWDVETGKCLRVLEGHTDKILCVSWSASQLYALTAGQDHTIRLWNLEIGKCLRVFQGHTDHVLSVELSADQRYALSGGQDMTVRLWDIETGQCLRLFQGHTGYVHSIALSTDKRFVLSGGQDATVQLWDVETGKCLRIFKGHRDSVNSVVWIKDQSQAISGSADMTLRLWDTKSGRCLRVLEGHRAPVKGLVLSPDNRHIISFSEDGQVRLWNIEIGRFVAQFNANNTQRLDCVAWVSFSSKSFVFVVSSLAAISIWNLTHLVNEPRLGKAAPDQVQYANAKVLLVGESGVGKTGLSRRLVAQGWEPSDSTVGAWATQWKLPESSTSSKTAVGKSPVAVEREIWLWDFGGQADQRLIHQLYMDETELVVLVFDGQKEDLFETLGQWDRDLTRASRKEFAKLLVAGRVDAGGLRVSRNEVEKFAAEHKFRGFLETSAKKNLGCKELKQAILTGINWEEIPCRTTEVLFKQLKEEIIRLKDEGRILMRFNELRETLQFRLSVDIKRFTDEELHAVLTLLAGPGVVWELAFGSWVLLQPERINAYAQAVIRTLQADEHQRGCLMEERVLKGELMYESSMPRLIGDEERFVLLAMHQTLVERGLCLRQPTSKGNLLVFPSYYRRERSDILQHPAVLVSYRFTGFLDEIYATLVVRLHHTEPFRQDQLWRYAADFKTNTGRQLGVKLTRIAPGMGELDLYFDPAIVIEEKIIFSKFIQEHLLQHAQDVERMRHYVCPQCGTPVGNREVAMQRLNDWLQGRSHQVKDGSRFNFSKVKEESPSIICVNCEQRVQLWDEMELCFASSTIQQQVLNLQEASAIELSNQSKERALVGEVISTVALADQISREFNVCDQGIDMEIEFTDDAHKATGAKLYLQLKSGDSWLYERKHDDAKIFTIKEERHARYWMAQNFPVLLVIRNSEGEIRWMEVRDWLKRASNNGKKNVKQIIFEGEQFDVMSVRRWRERVLFPKT